MSAYQEWRERVAKAWRDLDHTGATCENFWRALASRPSLPPEVLEARRRYEEDAEQFYGERAAGDQVAIDRNEMYMSDVTQAECAAGIHRYCVHDEAHDDNEYMSSMGYAGAPVGQVWGTVNSDGSVTARGFTDNESYYDDSAVHPVGSLVAYNAEADTWVHTATGQTTEKQQKIDESRYDGLACHDCDTDTGRNEYYMVRDQLWAAAAPDCHYDALCVGCLETRLGRSLTAQDFTDAPVNTRPDPQRSPRLTARLAALPKESPVNEATKGAVEGVSTITPTGLATTALSGATGKDIKSPLAAATTGGGTSGGGSGVSHAEEGNAQIQQAGQDIEGAMGAIQEIVNQLEAAQQNLTGAAEGSQHSEADTAMGALQEAVSAANDLQQQVGAAKQAVEDVKL